MNKPIILVTGATGAQGGSVARALLAQNKFAVRVITRNAHSDKAISLKAAGAEIVTGDMDDIESLQQAMKDCYGVFGITSFWEHFNKELEQGKNLINAVQKSGIRHFVLHTLPDYNKLSNGKYPTPHCDIKAALQQYCESLYLPATFLQVAFYYENFFSFFPFQKDDKGNFHFGFPQGDTKLSMTSVDDVGGVVAAIFNNPTEYIGKTVGVVGADDNCYAYAKIMSNTLQQNIQYHYIPRDDYAALGFPGAEELANMFEVQRLCILERQNDLALTYTLNPAAQSFENWVSKNKQQFQAMMQINKMEMI